MNKAIVIGSGFGGLAIANRLQARGIATTILEKNKQVGGHASQLIKNGYTFDMGPSLITAPKIIRSIFAAGGKKLEDYLSLTYLDPFYRMTFHDGSTLDYSGDSERMKQQLATFHPDDAAAYDRFIDYTREIYEIVIKDGMGSVPFYFSTLLPFMAKALKLNVTASMYHVVSKFFKDPRSRFAFSFHPLFIGGNPFRSPAVYAMIPYLEKTEGVWFSKCGMYSLVKALEKLFVDLGGKIHINHEVTEIVVKDNHVQGVKVGDTFFEGNIVISNAHFHHTYRDLIKPEHRRRWTDRRVDKLAYSMSCVLLFLGVRKKYPKLLHHNLVLAERYKGLITDIFDNKILADDFSMYLHVPSISDPDMAPDGCESMYVLIPVPNLAANIDWSQMATPYAEKVLTFLEHEFGLEGLQANLDVMEIFTPNDFKNVGNHYLGAAWGVEPKLTQTATFRPHNRSEDVKGLYLVGASTHPGAGVPGTMLTAETTEYVIAQDFGLI
ncbi:phytoene desaturase [candidate division KSB1 bacterium]|nr:phytoene desaturase [candidate division KSB1 bacterium]